MCIPLIALLEAVTILKLGVCAISKCAVTSTCVSSKVPFIDISAHVHKRRSLNVTWRCACTCVMSPSQFETTSKGGFDGIGSIRIDGAGQMQFNQLDPDLWCIVDRPLVITDYRYTLYLWWNRGVEVQN